MPVGRKAHFGIDHIIRRGPGDKDITAAVGGDGSIEVVGGAASGKGAALDDLLMDGVEFIESGPGKAAKINRVDLEEGIAYLGADIDKARVRGVQDIVNAYLGSVGRSGISRHRDGGGSQGWRSCRVGQGIKGHLSILNSGSHQKSIGIGVQHQGRRQGARQAGKQLGS